MAYALGAAALNTIGGLVGGAMSAGSSWKNYKRSAYLNHYLNQASLRESPTNARVGYENAGLNPILAAFNGNAPFQSGATSEGGRYDLGGIGDTLSNAYKTFKLEKQGVENQTKETNARVGLMYEQAETEQAKRTQMDFQNAMIDVETHLKQKDLDWYDRKAYSEIYELMQRAENYRAVQSIMSFNAQTDRQNAITNAKDANTRAGNLRLQEDALAGTIEKEKNLQQWYKDHPIQGRLLRGVERYASAASPFFGGAGQIGSAYMYTNAMRYGADAHYMSGNMNTTIEHLDRKGNIKSVTKKKSRRK